MSARPPRRALPYLLFAATIATTTWAGLLGNPGYVIWAGLRDPLGPFPPLAGPWFQYPRLWIPAVGYSAAFLGILLAHEMGHYITARRRGVRMSLPYFIPFPSLIGTLGAVIAMELRPMRAGKLLRIAAYGPFAGIVVAMPVLVVGLALSEVRPIPADLAVIELGDCLLLSAIEALVLPPIPDGHDVFLHPLALAGWAGCFVTSFNLMPIGQLDGGHIAYAMYGERYNRHAWLVLAALVVLGLTCFAGWLVLALLAAALIGVRHPPLTTDGAAQGVDRRIGRAAALLFILTFTPRPIGFPPLWRVVVDLVMGTDLAATPGAG